MSFTLGMKDGDYDFDDYGSPVAVAGTDKASQDVAQILVSAFDPRRGYGCRVQPGSVPNTAGEAFIATELNMTIERLQALQNSAHNTTTDERITHIASLDVSREADRVSYHYDLEVQTEQDSIAIGNSVTRRHVSMGHINP